MVNDVDISVDTQSNLPETWLWDKVGNDHKTITVSLLAQPKQTNGKISGNIYSIWKSPGNDDRVFLFLLRGETTGFRDTNRGDNSSLCHEGTQRSAVAVKDNFSEHLHGLRLGGRKDIQAFSQSWQKNTGKWVDPATLTKSGAGSMRVPCFHTELHCCDGQTASNAQSTVAQLRLLKVDFHFWHCIIVIFVGIVTLNYCILTHYFWVKQMPFLHELGLKCRISVR